MQIFDKILVGSGPSALGYLLALKRDHTEKCMIISSEAMCARKHSTHIKLNLGDVSIIDPLSGITHNLGGLSSAWGGLLPVLSSEDFKMISGFCDNELVYAAYKKILAEMSNYFNLYKLDGHILKKVASLNEITTNHTETYVISSKEPYGWESFGMSVFRMIEDKAKELNWDLNIGEVKSINREGGYWILNLGYKKIFTRELILSCGAIGNLSLLSQLDGGFKKYKSYLVDHTPIKIYALKIGCLSSLTPLLDNSTPVVNIVRNKNFICSMYSISKLSLSFIRKLGLPGIFFCLIPNFIRNRIYFMQIWDEFTHGFIVNSNKKTRTRNSYLIKAIKLGFLPIWTSKTPAGEGFHYTLSDFNSFNHELIKYRGLTILGGIGNSFYMKENPTLTFMVDSYLKANSTVD